MTVLDAATREGLISRIKTLDASCTPLWGTMNLHQMLEHVTKVEEMYLDPAQQKQSFIGKLFGKFALKGLTKDDAPMRRNSPTVPAFKVTEKSPVTTDVEAQKAKWISMIERYGKPMSDHYSHPFFGTMTKDQTAQLAYKHVDHHLRQFGK